MQVITCMSYKERYTVLMFCQYSCNTFPKVMVYEPTVREIQELVRGDSVAEHDHNN
jgi:hypothetical protein